MMSSCVLICSLGPESNKQGVHAPLRGPKLRSQLVQAEDAQCLGIQYQFFQRRFENERRHINTHQSRTIQVKETSVLAPAKSEAVKKHP